MLNLQKTRVGHSHEVPYIGARPYSGQPLISATGSSATGISAQNPIDGIPVTVATGVEDEIFRGIAMLPVSAETEVAEIFQVTVGAGLDATTALTGLKAASARVTKADGTVVALDGVTEANRVSTLDFTTEGTDGDILTVTIARTLTASEAYASSGPSDQIGVNNPIQQCTSINDGVIHTSAFDTAVEWKADSVVKLGAGIFTSGRTGTTVKCTVVQIPTAENPYLGLELSSAAV